MAIIQLDVNQEKIGVLTINRPETRNALNWEAMEEFTRKVEESYAADLKVLIVTGTGTAFASGGDLKELHNNPNASGLRLATTMGDALARLDAMPNPTIAAINGFARGGGAEIAMACDVRIMSETADIGFVHTRLGLAPGWGGAQRLMRAVGYSHALELLATGRVVKAQEALALRMVNWAVPQDQVLKAAYLLAKKIAAQPQEAVRAAKRMLHFTLPDSEREVRMAERAEFPPLWESDVHTGALNKYLEDKNIDLE